MIIGVTGTLCSGKDSFADYLMEKGFVHISLADLLREELKNRGVKVTIENLRVWGNKIREERGSDFLSKKAIEKLSHKNNFIITSIRSLGEASALLLLKNFVLIGLDAPSNLRFNRMIKRGKKENEPSTFEDFIEFENKQINSTAHTHQNLRGCMNLAHHTVVNDGDIDMFHRKIDSLLDEIFR